MIEKCTRCETAMSDIRCEDVRSGCADVYGTFLWKRTVYAQMLSGTKGPRKTNDEDSSCCTTWNKSYLSIVPRCPEPSPVSFDTTWLATLSDCSRIFPAAVPDTPSGSWMEFSSVLLLVVLLLKVVLEVLMACGSRDVQGVTWGLDPHSILRSTSICVSHSIHSPIANILSLVDVWFSLIFSLID